MNTALREYFRTFGNPDYPEDDYWEKDPNLAQVIFGIIVAPIAIAGYVIYKICMIRISL